MQSKKYCYLSVISPSKILWHTHQSHEAKDNRGPLDKLEGVDGTARLDASQPKSARVHPCSHRLCQPTTNTATSSLTGSLSGVVLPSFPPAECFLPLSSYIANHGLSSLFNSLSLVLLSELSIRLHRESESVERRYSERFWKKKITIKELIKTGRNDSLRQ